MGLFGRTGDEIDRAAERILEILKKRVEEIEVKEDATIEEPRTLSESEEKPLLEPQKIAEFLDPIGGELEQLETILAKVRPKIDSIHRLVPRLNEIKVLLEKDVNIRKTKNAETITLVQNLEKQRETLREDMDRKNRKIEEMQRQVDQEEERFAQIDSEIPKLQLQKQMNEDIITREDEDVNKVDGNIRRILNLRSFSEKRSS